ncbi:hypothetical protein FKV75_03875 [Weissella paramesenteroides]|nr:MULTISPECIES: hypothetical protein [Weissella]KAA8440436.1 hypothetical protein FKV77_08130 [Weissella paramesenteroides]KAA8440973.1 hypothetical protein FKV81_04850 [Weissella paramesenteroides]KAA8443404.1 hypothetical protein FKV75_03875 [Weissella paramesenteroides]KAA8447693.1 hypothetical protein FKV76_04095 [Weissella paramesenteroides]KAA8449704.1 hypothetical protein FKV74_05820 [Weissella paramesenteroides]
MMEYNVLSALTIKNMTEVVLDVDRLKVSEYKVARDSDGNFFEVIRPTLPGKLPAKASFLLKGTFKGDTISLYQ